MLPCASCCLLVINFGRSSPATISFWVIRRSGDGFCTGTSAPIAMACGTSIGDISSEHCELHSVEERKKEKKNL
jgi:hypothetical protein